MVIPTQVTPVQIHGGEVENDLKNKEDNYWQSMGQKSHTAHAQTNGKWQRTCPVLALTSVLGDLITSGQLWVQGWTHPRHTESTFQIRSLSLYLEKVWATCGHILLAGWMQTCPGPHWGTKYSIDIFCYLLVPRQFHNDPKLSMCHIYMYTYMHWLKPYFTVVLCTSPALTSVVSCHRLRTTMFICILFVSNKLTSDNKQALRDTCGHILSICLASIEQLHEQLELTTCGDLKMHINARSEQSHQRQIGMQSSLFVLGCL